ncbi:hypothetical protein AOL_s00215g621 [Orbilia oligospora ATCC 24927]|uniref:Uncharacterized protein n=1 Tax=Arthrobotrys oligospora (strain ATCC 24927 / CBS 115.81 / DSM 1491) TaxID=756982 RepID=G1XUG3_ARTOA|nr:hypothetical protein AOL_s00215g621 [Orbilia oligospora ATCC 24927]EGX43165.1 hypothetical protein AOL_s00215g621 [Orbilia oligospora ATCC 24927]
MVYNKQQQQHVAKIIRRSDGTILRRVSLEKPSRKILDFSKHLLGPQTKKVSKRTKFPSVRLVVYQTNLEVEKRIQNETTKYYWVLKAKNKAANESGHGSVQKQLFLDTESHPTDMLLEKPAPIQKHLRCCMMKTCKAARCLEALRNKSTSR